MKIVVPYKRLAYTTRVVMERAECALWLPPIEYHEMRGEWDYWALIVELWRGGEGFLVIEQDIVPTLSQLTEMTGCDRELCVTGYMLRGLETWSLGCAKFSTDLITRTPLVLPEWWQEASRPPRWWEVDAALFGIVLPRIEPPFTPHRHPGRVAHVRDLTLDRPHGHG